MSTKYNKYDYQRIPHEASMGKQVLAALAIAFIPFVIMATAINPRQPKGAETFIGIVVLLGSLAGGSYVAHKLTK